MFHFVVVQIEEIQDELERAGEEPPEEGHGFELSLVRYREATKLFAEAAADAASVSTQKIDPNDTSACNSKHQFVDYVLFLDDFRIAF